MKRHMMKLNFLLASALLLTACSKDAVDNNAKQQEGLVFTMSEAPYNADVDVATRSGVSAVIKDTLDFGGIEAEVTLERDAALPQPQTRAVTSGNHYTIVAFKAGTAQAVAEMKGYFDTGTGKFKYESGSDMIRIPAGNYDFACYTHQYATRVGNKVTIPLANADKAFVCRAENITIADVKRQEVAFTMKHAGVRLRTKLICLEEPTGINATLGYQSGKTSAAGVYDLTTGAFASSTDKSTTTQMSAQSYDDTGTVHNTALDDDLSTATGNQYVTIPAGIKPEEVFYQITAGMVYGKTINTNGARKMKASGDFEANGSYTLTIKLMPKYKYLFEDGQAGYLSDADRKAHVPIAVVFAPNKAIALWDANGGTRVQWDPNANFTNRYNSTTFTTPQDAVSNTTSGQVWTWEKNFSGQAKAEVSRFEAYYYAGNFYNSADLTSKVTLTGTNINKSEAWYLPSWYEWKEVFVNLGFGNGSQVTGAGTFQWKGKFVNYAFTVANGTSIVPKNITWNWYWASSEFQAYNACTVQPSRGSVWFNLDFKIGKYLVRPFVIF